MICLPPATVFKYHCAMQHANSDWLVQDGEKMIVGSSFSKVIWTWFEPMNLNLYRSSRMQNSVCKKPTGTENWKNIGWGSQSWLPNEAYKFTRRHLTAPPTNSGQICREQSNFELVVQLGVFSHWHVISETSLSLNMDSDTKFC